MAEGKMQHRIENGNVLVLEREFDAPQELVFEMFAKCEHLSHWWGPREFELTHCEMDFRPGGTWHYCMTGVDESLGEFHGMESWGKAVYGEISEPDRIDYTDWFSDAEGNVNEGLPASKIRMEFLQANGRTTLVNRAEYISADALEQVLDMGMLAGIAATWDKLEEYLVRR